MVESPRDASFNSVRKKVNTAFMSYPLLVIIELYF